MTTRGSAWSLALAAWIFIALFTRSGTTSAHEWSRLGTVESVVDRHNFFLEESKFRGTRDKIFRDGHFYSHQPPLLAVMVSPVYWVIHKAGFQLSNSASGDRPLYLFVLFTNGLAFALTVWLLRRILERLGAPPGRATVAAFVLPLGTWLFPYAVVTNNHGISAMLLMVAINAMLSIELDEDSHRQATILGGALGLMTAFEVLPIVSFVPATMLFVWLRRDRINTPALRSMAIAFTVPLIAHAILNVGITGDVIPAGFHTELFQFEGTTFTASELTGSIKHTSIPALAAYAWQALIMGKGYFTLAPVLALGAIAAVLASPWWAKARATHVALVLGTAASLGAALLTTNNSGGAAVGFRHATYLAPAFLVWLGPIFASRSRAAMVASWAVLAVAVISAVILWWYAVRQPWIDLRIPLVLPW